MNVDIIATLAMICLLSTVRLISAQACSGSETVLRHHVLVLVQFVLFPELQFLGMLILSVLTPCHLQLFPCVCIV
ncbi:hypothetical protein VTK56DRAFT_7220 [Thermocarpiscus australiensis]